MLESQAQNDCFFEMAGIHAWSSPLFFFRYWAVFLCKNSNLALFIERYAGKGCLAQLPERLQEAIVTYSEHDPDYCREHGVSENTIERFTRFRQEVLNLRRSGATNISRLASEYGNTFWYYMLK